MIMREKRLVAIIVGLVFITIATPLSAQSRQGRLGAGERTAIHECSVKAAKHKDYADELDHLYTFRTCMFEHGVPGN